MNVPDREAWVDRAIALLEHSAESLDAATLSRLNRARQAALAQQPQRFAPRAWWLAGGIASAALALVIALGVGMHQRAASPILGASTDQQGSDADPLAGDDNLDLYENLDFYAWLDAEQKDVGG